MHTESTKKMVKMMSWYIQKSTRLLACSSLLVCSLSLLAEWNALGRVSAISGAVKQSSEIDYPYINMTEVVTTKTTKSGKKSTIESGEVVTFTITITNLDDVERVRNFKTALPKGLTYVSGSLSLDDVKKEGVIVDDEYGSTLSLANLNLPAYSPDKAVTLSFQAQVDAFSSDQHVAFWHYSELEFEGHPGLGANSNRVTLVAVGYPTENPAAFFEVSEAVTTETTAKASQRVDVRPGDVVTFTLIIENQGELAGKADFSTYLQEGLNYVAHSFMMDGEVQADVAVSQGFLRGSQLSVPAFGQCGNPVTVSFQAQVDSSLPEGITRFDHASSLYPRGEPFVQYAALSNPVVIVIHRD